MNKTISADAHDAASRTEHWLPGRDCMAFRLVSSMPFAGGLDVYMVAGDRAWYATQNFGILSFNESVPFFNCSPPGIPPPCDDKLVS